jgi:hypothetical protein
MTIAQWRASPPHAANMMLLGCKSIAHARVALRATLFGQWRPVNNSASEPFRLPTLHAAAVKDPMKCFNFNLGPESPSRLDSNHHLPGRSWDLRL